MRVPMSGDIVPDSQVWLYDWFDIPCISPAAVRNAIAENPEGEDLVLEINSGGGSVFAGFEMYSVLRNAPCRTVAEVQSLAASAASTMMLGCQEVTASPVAQVMIHRPSTATDGDRDDHMASVGVLDSIMESILNAYTIKCGTRATRDQLQDLMEQSTWMTATQARDLGLVDKITGAEDIDPSTVLNCAGVGAGIRALAAFPKPTYDSLLAEYHRLVAAGKAPAEGRIPTPPAEEPDTTNDSALELAKLRLRLEKIRI